MPTKPGSLWRHPTATPPRALNNARCCTHVVGCEEPLSHKISFHCLLTWTNFILWVVLTVTQTQLCHFASIYRKALSMCAFQNLLDPLPPPVNERSSPVCPLYIYIHILSSPGCSITPQQASRTPELTPTALLSVISFIRGPYHPVHPATNYQTNEPSRWI